MQIENELKEILLELYSQASADGKYDRCVPLSVVINGYADKILALGKPRPLAKNKDCDGNFICYLYESKQEKTKCESPCG